MCFIWKRDAAAREREMQTHTCSSESQFLESISVETVECDAQRNEMKWNINKDCCSLVYRLVLRYRCKICECVCVCAYR